MSPIHSSGLEFGNEANCWPGTKFRYPDASFSSEGRFVIVGSSTRTVIWKATVREVAFDTDIALTQSISFSEAKEAIQNSASTAHRMGPISLWTSRTASRPSESAHYAAELTLDIIFNVVPDHTPPAQ